MELQNLKFKQTHQKGINTQLNHIGALLNAIHGIYKQTHAFRFEWITLVSDIFCVLHIHRRLIVFAHDVRENDSRLQVQCGANILCHFNVNFDVNLISLYFPIISNLSSIIISIGLGFFLTFKKKLVYSTISTTATESTLLSDVSEI